MRRIVSGPEPEQLLDFEWTALETLARQALDTLSAGDHPDAIALRKQLASAEFEQLEFTGAGFFLTLRIPPNIPRLSRDGVIGDAHVEGVGYEAPLGLLIFVRGGVATMLEGFGYGAWPNELGAYRLQYVRWEPHSATGATAVNVAERDPESMWTG